MLLFPRVGFGHSFSCEQYKHSFRACEYLRSLEMHSWVPKYVCMKSPLPYSPNNFLTLFITLSFSGSYGWSLLGISNTDGKASL